MTETETETETTNTMKKSCATKFAVFACAALASVLVGVVKYAARHGGDAAVELIVSLPTSPPKVCCADTDPPPDFDDYFDTDFSAPDVPPIRPEGDPWEMSLPPDETMEDTGNSTSVSSTTQRLRIPRPTTWGDDAAKWGAGGVNAGVDVARSSGVGGSVTTLVSSNMGNLLSTMILAAVTTSTFWEMI
jgi:hypothetical protein